jgi:hypothetical protein
MPERTKMFCRTCGAVFDQLQERPAGVPKTCCGRAVERLPARPRGQLGGDASAGYRQREYDGKVQVRVPIRLNAYNEIVEWRWVDKDAAASWDVTRWRPVGG